MTDPTYCETVNACSKSVDGGGRRECRHDCCRLVRVGLLSARTTVLEVVIPKTLGKLSGGSSFENFEFFALKRGEQEESCWRG